MLMSESLTDYAVRFQRLPQLRVICRSFFKHGLWFSLQPALEGARAGIEVACVMQGLNETRLARVSCRRDLHVYKASDLRRMPCSARVRLMFLTVINAHSLKSLCVSISEAFYDRCSTLFFVRAPMSPQGTMRNSIGTNRRIGQMLGM